MFWMHGSCNHDASSDTYSNIITHYTLPPHWNNKIKQKIVYKRVQYWTLSMLNISNATYRTNSVEKKMNIYKYIYDTNTQTYMSVWSVLRYIARRIGIFLISPSCPWVYEAWEWNFLFVVFAYAAAVVVSIPSTCQMSMRELCFIATSLLSSQTQIRTIGSRTITIP